MGLDKLKGIAAPGGADTGLKEAVEKTLAEPVIEDIIIINAGKKNKADIPAGYEKIGIHRLGNGFTLYSNTRPG